MEVTLKESELIQNNRGEETLRAILESTADGILVVNKEGKVIHTNPKFVEMWKIPQELVTTGEDEKLLQHVLDQLLEPQAFLSKVQELYSGREKDFDTIQFKDGRIFERYSCPLVTHCESLEGRVWSFRDITAQKKTEEELAKAKQIAETSNKTKSEFLAAMSHEIRTPMTAILGFTDLLLSSDLSYEEQQNYLKTIQKNGKVLLELVNDILDLSKVEAGKLTIKQIDCAPLQIVEEVTCLMSNRAKEKELELNVNPKFPLPRFIRTDPVRLKQILVNVISNALKFTDEGKIDISVYYQQSQLNFSISDTGIGMSPEQIQKLFNPFYQGESVRGRQPAGSGLGLAISKRLIEMLGGNIQVESTVGKGSTFSLALKADPTAELIS